MAVGEPDGRSEEIDDEAEARALDEAEADVAAGRMVLQENVIEWLKSWGTTHERELAFVRPYVIRSRVEGNRVIVMPVRHGRQRPPNP